MSFHVPRRPTSSGDPVSTSSATLPRSLRSRSVRATAERQYWQTTTIDCPLLNSTGPPHDGQFATRALIEQRLQLEGRFVRTCVPLLHLHPVSLSTSAPTASSCVRDSNRG